MKRFRFSLQALHEIRQRARQEAEQDLARAEAGVASANAQLEQLQQTRDSALRATAGAPGYFNLHEAALQAQYVAALDLRIVAAWQQVAACERERDQRRRLAVAAATEAEATQKLRAQHLSRYEAEAARAEQGLLDEMAALAGARRIREAQ